MAFQAPVITEVNEDQAKFFAGYIEDMRLDVTATARREAERLKPYFGALAAQLKDDMKAAAEEPIAPVPLSTRGVLSRLFNAIAERTTVTVLSEWVLAPHQLLQNEAATGKIAMQDILGMSYEGTRFTLGFLYTSDEKNTKSVHIPVMTLDDQLMECIEPFRTESLLRAMQAVATAGNHDMVHHYTNTANVAQFSMDGVMRPLMNASDWGNRHLPVGGAEDPATYESWLMLNHRRIQRRLEEGPEGKILQQHCDTFFDELSRIGEEVAKAASAAEAHKAVDYFGSVMLFTMMRYMPFDHPLMQHAIERLKEADPDPDAVKLKRMRLDERNKTRIRDTFANYKAHDVNLSPKAAGYAKTKRLQLMRIAPWVAHLMSPAQPETRLARMQEEERVGAVNIDMIRASAAGVWFNMKNGHHTLVKPDGTKIEVWLRNGQPAHRNGPAITVTFTMGTVASEEWWYKGGKMCRRVTNETDGTSFESFLGGKTRQYHRTDGPACIKTLPDGTKEERWYIEGIEIAPPQKPAQTFTTRPRQKQTRESAHTL